MPTDEKPKRPRGWASLSPEVHRELCRKGGIAAHAAGTAHEFTTEEAREAGRKGGVEAHRRRRERLAEDDRRSFGEVAVKGQGT